MTVSAVRSNLLDVATELQEVSRLTVLASETVQQRDEAIRDAHKASNTIRAIAAAAGLSPARVHQILHYR